MWSPTISSDAIYHSAIAHSARGTSWKKANHKYIRKEGDRYIYKERSHSGSSGGINDKKKKSNKLFKAAKLVGRIVSPSVVGLLDNGTNAVSSAKYLKDTYDANHQVKQYEEKQNGMSRKEAQALMIKGAKYVGNKALDQIDKKYDVSTKITTKTKKANRKASMLSRKARRRKTQAEMKARNEANKRHNELFAEANKKARIARRTAKHKKQVTYLRAKNKITRLV